MIKRRHFLYRTFGKFWKLYFPFFILVSFIIAFTPTLIFFKELQINIPKFCEEWLRTILSLSAIFLIINYLNYQININRSKDKISMLATNFNVIADGLFDMLIKNDFSKKNEMLNLVNALESLLKKIQSEDEFFYNSIGISNFSNHHNFFEKIKNHINSTQMSSIQITRLKADFLEIKKYLSQYI